MDSSSYRHLAFLLSLGGIPLACTSDDTSETSDTSPTGTTSGGTATTSEATSDGSGTMGATSEATSASASATTSSETTGGVMGGCESYAAKDVECYRSDYDESLAYCKEALAGYEELYGSECAAAFEDLMTCFGSLTCEQLMEPIDCYAEFNTASMLCIPRVGEACAAFAAKYAECSGEDPSYIGGECQMAINQASMEYGAACGAAYEDYYACLGALSCADFDGEGNCPDEVAAIGEACI